MAIVAKVDVYSHHFVLSKYTREVYLMALEFSRPLIQMGLKPVRGGRFVPVMEKVFAAAPNDRIYIRYSLSLLQNFFDYAKQKGFDKDSFQLTVHELFEPAPLKSKMKKGFELRDYQIPIVEFCKEPDRPLRMVVVQPGKGKAQPLSSPVKIPGGWTTMGKLKVGDTITAWDGTPTRVTGVFPQGSKEIFKITFYDGRCTLASADHLWKVFYVNTTKARQWRIVDTREMLRLISMPNPRVYVPLCASEVGEDVSLPVDPYLLGVLISDGSLGPGVGVTKADQELFDNIEPLLPDGVRLQLRKERPGKCMSYGLISDGGKNNLIEALKELGLYGSRSWTKFIPDAYLTASTEQRWSLLQGLMDTDGTANKIGEGGSISYTTTSLKLAKCVQYLVHSLGGIAKLSLKRPHYQYKGEKRFGRLAYNVLIRMKTPSKIFRLGRKKERTNDANQYAEGLKLRVDSVVPYGVEECQCISIDHPDHLYVTDHFVVTHNTAMASKAAEELGHRIAVVVPAMYVDKWVSDFDELYQDGGKSCMVVKGYKQLKALVQLAKAGGLTDDFIVISSTSMQIFLKMWEEDRNETLELCCDPVDFFKVLGVGTRIIDEVHKGIHLNIKMDLYTHVPKAIYLTGTIIASNPFINRMTEMAYPVKDRYQGLAYDKYIGVTALEYRLRSLNGVRWTGRRKEYSHVTYEASLLKSDSRRINFAKMVLDLVRALYCDIAQPKQTCLVFASSVEMCTFLAKCLKEALPNWKVGRYVSEDDYSILMDNDIVVSTVLSAGTAVDKYGLITVIMTNAIDSRQSNEQTMGRLRRLPDWPDVTPMFYYLVCGDIDKHVAYHQRKRQLLEDKALWQRYEILSYSI